MTRRLRPVPAPVNDEAGWSDHPGEHWEQGTEPNVLGLAAAMDMRDTMMDNGLSKWRKLQDKLDAAYDDLSEFEKQVGRRYRQILVAKCYPDPQAPESVIAEGQEPVAVDSVRAEKLAEAEVKELWEGQLPAVRIEALKRRIAMVNAHVEIRGRQMNAGQTELRANVGAIERNGLR